MDEKLLLKAGDIVAAYVSKNDIPTDQVLTLLASVAEKMNSLMQLDDDASHPRPAVPIDQSVTNDHIICLEDGKPVVLLKRYLAKHHNLTPEEYFKKWGLPDDYPLVAKAYSEKRSAIAKDHGLGRT